MEGGWPPPLKASFPLLLPFPEAASDIRRVSKSRERACSSRYSLACPHPFPFLSYPTLVMPCCWFFSSLAGQTSLGEEIRLESGMNVIGQGMGWGRTRC